MVPPWYAIADGEIGVSEVRGGENRRIVEYHSSTSLKASTDEVPWCASFVNWCLQRAGIKGTGSAAALSFMGYGTPSEPRLGAIVVLSRSPGLGHVGFWAGERTTEVRLLSGNHKDAVGMGYYPKSRILAIRWPYEPVIVA